MSVDTLKSPPLRGAVLAARDERRGVNLIYGGALAASFLIAYLPTYVALAKGPWQTEQEGHGPLIMLAAAWLAWQQRDQARLRLVQAGAHRRLVHPRWSPCFSWR